MTNKILFLIFTLFFSITFIYGQNANVAIANRAYEQEQKIPANSTVRGRVFYENTGRPVRRASIMLMTQDGGGEREVTGLTDNNGYFQIKNLKAGTYYAFVNAPGVVSPLAYINVNRPRTEGFGDAIEGFQPIVVNGISDIDVEIPAKLGGAVGGRVLYSNGDPAIGVKVEILRKTEDYFLPVISNFSAIFSMLGGGSNGFQTDDRGVYRFSGLPAGEYIVKVSENASHGDTNTRNYYDPLGSLFGGFSLLTLYYPDVFETEKAEIINVVPGQENYEINITIPDRDLYRIEGKIISAKTKSPIENAQISIKRVGDNTVSIFDSPGRGRQNILTDEQGKWNFKELPKGTYKISIEADEKILEETGKYPSNVMIMNSNAAAYNRNNTVKYAKRVQEIVIDDKNLSGIVIELGFGATISGTVITENSREMPSLVTIYATDEEGDNNLSESIQNEKVESKHPQKLNHEFELQSVSAEKNYFRVLVDDEDFYVKSATAGNKDLLVDSIELTEGEILRNVKIILGNDVGTIKGKVFDKNNEPMKKADLTLIPTDAVKRKNPSFYRHFTVDENGEFTIKAAPYEYAVVKIDKKIADKSFEDFYKWLNEVIENAQKVTVKAGETTSMKLLLP